MTSLSPGIPGSSSVSLATPEVDVARRGPRVLALNVIVSTLLLLSGCGADPTPPTHDGPIVLITIDTLRADVIGALGGIEGMTPNLDALASESPWAGRAVASSSWTVPSMASIFTGLQPWSHGAIHGERTVLADSLTTLPEALGEAGYHTLAFRSNSFLTRKNGYAQGFDEFFNLGGRKRAVARLKALDGRRQFIWIHVLPPHAPYVKREHLAARLENLRGPDGSPVPMPSTASLPERVRPLDLEPWYDPNRPLDPADRQRLLAMYLMNVGFADQIVGELITAIRESGQWDRTLIAVTSDHGEEFGESGQIVHGGNLNRVLVEVPLLIKLPAGFRRLHPAPGVANTRLYATLLEAAGATVPPEAAPSLFETSSSPVLSELYLGNGINRFSLADGRNQLQWTSRFGAEEPSYYDARIVRMGGNPPKPLEENADCPFVRLREAFEDVPPLTGLDPTPALTHWRWLEDSGVESAPASFPSLELETAFLASGPDTPPRERFGIVESSSLSREERDELRALGYVVPEEESEGETQKGDDCGE